MEAEATVNGSEFLEGTVEGKNELAYSEGKHLSWHEIGRKYLTYHYAVG